MALRVWLPLNGSLENQGISGIVPTMMGSVSLTETGKIGKCAYFSNNPANCVYMDGLQQINNFSWTCWFKCVGEGSAAYQFLLSEGRDCVQYGVNLRLTKEGTGLFAEVGANSAVVRTSTKTVELNKWYHAAMTISNTELKLYVDGELFNTKTLTLVPNYEQSNNKFVIGKMAHGYTGTGSYFPFNGYVNDVRIYDHCLSPKEVKEISQGLVLHYKLDTLSTGLNNLAQSGTPSLYNNFASSGTTGSVSATGEYYNGAPIYRMTITPNDTSLSNFKSTIHSHGIYNWNRTFTANTKYCFWIYYKPVTHMDVRVGGTASNIGGWTEIAPEAVGNGWYRVGQYRSGSVTENKTDNIFVSFYTPTAVSGTAIQIDFASPFLLEGTTQIDKGAFWGLNGTNKVTDSSGYSNDGIITGTLETNTSDRYLVSTKFPSNACYIKLPEITYSNFGNSYTFSWWEYMATVSGGPMPWGFSNGNRLNCYHTTNLCWNTGDGGNNPFTPTKTAASLVDNKWHHMVITGDGTATQLYIDGVNVGKATTYKALTGTQIYISGWDTGTSYKMTNNSMSDFRIYTTALSAEDILDLYHTPANIDNLQSIHSFEFNEQLTQNIINDWTDINLISMNGWSGSKSYNSNYNYLVLTATNGWRTFAWSTGGLISQPCVFEFDYYLADNTNLSSTGIFIINRNTIDYGVPLMQLNTTLNKWNHCKFETNSALKYLGFNIRGTDNTGNSVILYVRNISISPSSIGSINRISKNGIFFNNTMRENKKILNTATSGTFTPTNINNSTINYAIIDFREYSSLGKDLKVHIEADVEWTAFTGSGDGTFRGVWFQGANYKINSDSVWSGANYICSALNSQYNLQSETKLSTAGAYHYNTTTTIPASWFETYERSNFGMRCDYSDGTGTFKIKNFKVTISEDSNARITKDAILANSFIEK